MLANAVPAQGAGDFDFLLGRWTVAHRKLTERLRGSSNWIGFPGTLAVAPILAGAGNFDRNELLDPAGPYQAHCLRLFRPATGAWSIWWFDGRAPRMENPVVGGFEGPVGTFFGEDVLRGAPVKVRTAYERQSGDSARWNQAFSADGGASWETNWIMDFQRTTS